MGPTAVPNAVLIVIGKNSERAVLDLQGERTSIGRGPDNTVTLQDEKLSRHHCVIRRRPDGDLEVEDLKSLNGTRVNGKPIRRVTRLSIGDTVVLGNTTMIVESEDSPLLDTEAIQTVTNSDNLDARRQEQVGAETEIPGRPSNLAGTMHGTMFAPSETGFFPGDATSARLVQENAFLRRLLEINKQINSDLTSQKVLVAIVDAAIELTQAERGFLLLAENGKKDSENLKVAVARNLDREKIVHPRLSSTILDRVLKTGESRLVADAQHEGELSEARSIRDLAIQSVLCVPLKVQGQVIGALYLDHRWRQEAFSGATIELVEAFADQAALSIHNSRLIAEVEAKAKELEAHAQQIARLNKELEERFEQQTAELTAVRSQLELVGEETQQTATKFQEIIGSSPALLNVLKNVDKVSDTELPVYIHGEPGTGKELIAKALHRHSRRANKPFVAVNCAAFTESLLQSELFGYAKGSFTGADRDKPGLFEEADGGTLFLDEIGDMSPNMQSQLLRVLQEGELRRVGETGRTRKVHVRVISASNKDLQEMIETSEFREDLFYRLHTVRLELPPLRDRREDIPELVNFFIKKICADPAHPIEPIPTIDRKVLKALINYHWPGNIRELQNELKKMIALRDGNHIGLDQVSEKILEKPKGAELDELGRTTLKAMIDSLESSVIRQALKKFKYNKSRVADALGLSRLGLRKKMERFGIPPEPDDTD